MMEWITQNWAAIGAVVALFIQVINRVTRHWSEAKTIPGQIALLLTEIASVVTSRGASTKLGVFKLPIQSVKPKAKATP